MKYATPKQYILNSLYNFPTLYSSENYETCSLKILDQLLNVIGNGIRNDDELLAYFSQEIPNNIEELANKYITNECMFYGYLDEKYSKHIICLDSERHLHPDVVIWIDDKSRPFKPYPNFDKKYSTVYQTNILSLSQEWRDTIVWFYEQCRQYFLSDRVRSYHHYFGADMDDPRDVRIINKYKEIIESRLKSSVYKNNAEVSKAYDTEFDGDYVKFIKLRWDNELTRILNFIDETINFVKNYNI